MFTSKKHVILCGVVCALATACSSNQNLSANRPTASSSSGSSTSSPTNVRSGGSERAVAQQIFTLINQERVRNGRKKLRGHPAVNKLAEQHSRYLAQQRNISTHAAHHGAHNRSQFAYLRHNVENLTEMATSASSASEAVAKWKSSPDHRKHMLQAWDVTGIGVTRGGDGRYYIVQAMGAVLTNVPRGVQPIGW